jgi:hypothetical protein
MCVTLCYVVGLLRNKLNLLNHPLLLGLFKHRQQPQVIPTY